jgi:cytochrome c oxidase subunit 4
MSLRMISRTTYFLVWLALMALLIATVVAASFDLGWLNSVIAIGIAICKTLLIVLFFMHVRVSSRLTWVFAGAGFFWLGILITLAMSDYISRGWLPGTGK